MKHNSLIKEWICLIALITLCIAGLFNAKSIYGEAPIKIGYSTDFSGVTAQFGIIEAPVAKMVIEQVNKAGGINGRKIELFILDNGSDPAKLLANLKLFKEKHNCVAMMTGVTTGVNLVAKKWAEENHIPMISPDALGEKLWQKEGKAWWFKAHTVESVFTEVTLARAKELGHTRIGFEGTTLAWGRDSLHMIREIAPKHGVSIVGDVLCEPKSKDLSIQVRNLKNTGATAVIMADYEAELGVWARGYMNIGWKPYSISVSGSTFYGALKTYPVELFEGWETTQLMDITKPIVKKVWDEYEAYTGKRYEDEKVPRTWDAIRFLIEAIKLSGNPDNPEAIRDAFYKIKGFPIAIGRMETKGSFAIGRNYFLGVEDIPVYVVRSGRFVPAQRK